MNAITEQQQKEQTDLILSTVGVELDLMEARQRFLDANDKLKDKLLCPVCGMNNIEITQSFGRWYFHCTNCDFNPGKAQSLEEVLMRWLSIMEAINELPDKTDNETTKTA